MRNVLIGFVAIAVLVAAATTQAKTRYTRSVAGLEEQIGDIVTTAADGPSDLLTYRLRQLVIPSHGNYFSNVFGFEHYRPVADEYGQLSKDIEPLARLFVTLAERGQLGPTANALVAKLLVVGFDLLDHPRPLGLRGNDLAADGRRPTFDVGRTHRLLN